MMTDITVQMASWDDDSDQLIQLRTVVFIEEQQVPVSLEIDGMDKQCKHVKAVNPEGVIMGTARLLPSSYIGRMCVLKEYRKMGIGGKMLVFFIDYARQNKIEYLHLNAQITALSFYQNYGFIANSEVFIEADIEHVHMTLSLAD